MQNHLTFKNVMAALTDCLNRDYTQVALFLDLFSLYFEENKSMGIITDENALNTTISRYFNGKRPIISDILKHYETPEGVLRIKQDFKDRILPKMQNIPRARQKVGELVQLSAPVISEEKAQELLSPEDPADFFTGVILYSIFTDHKETYRRSPDLSDHIVNTRVPKPGDTFIGRASELKECSEKLETGSPLFICGVAGIGKSEFAKKFISENKKDYTNLLYLFYLGDLKRTIAALHFYDDNESDSEEELFTRHYNILRLCGEDTLIILDNFDVYPEDDKFFHEFSKNGFRLIVTTRCNLPHRNTLILSEMETRSDLMTLFLKLCPGAITASNGEGNNITDIIYEIIDTVHSHTLTVSLVALTLAASGITAVKLLEELKSCTLSPPSGEPVEINKDNTYTDGLMQEHLRHLLKLNNLSETEIYLLMNISLLPLEGISKTRLKEVLLLPNLTDAIKLVRYGFMQNDEENHKYLLHPLIRDIVTIETQPSISKCRILFDHFHSATMVQGAEFERPQEVLRCLISITERIINDDPKLYLWFLQDSFSYYHKFLMYDEMTNTRNRMEAVMKEYKLEDPRDKALLLDYSSQLMLHNDDCTGAAKLSLRAIKIMERIPESEYDTLTIATLSNLYNNLGTVLLASKQLQDASEAFDHAIRLRIENGLFESHDTINQIINIITLYCKTGNIKAASDLLDICEPILRNSGGENTLDYGIYMMNRAITYIFTGDVDAAITLLNRSRKVITDTIGSNNDYISSITYYLTTAHSMKQNNLKAVVYDETQGKLKDKKSRIQ